MMMTHNERAGVNSPAGKGGGEVAGAADEKRNAYAYLVSKSEKLFETRIKDREMTVELWNTGNRLLTVVVKSNGEIVEFWTKEVGGANEVNEVLAEFRACAGGE